MPLQCLRCLVSLARQSEHSQQGLRVLTRLGHVDEQEEVHDDSSHADELLAVPRLFHYCTTLPEEAFLASWLLATLVIGLVREL